MIIRKSHLLNRDSLWTFLNVDRHFFPKLFNDDQVEGYVRINRNLCRSIEIFSVDGQCDEQNNTH